MDRETLSSRLKDKKGTVTVTVAVLLIFLIMFAAFAIDVGYMMVRRNELQNIADTAALSAAGQLGASYPQDYIQAIAYTPSPAPLLAEAQLVASGTGVSGVTITPPSTDFQLGVWNPSSHTFTPRATQPTAVKVTAHRDSGTPNGPFSTLLAGVLGIGTFNVSATATASLTPLSDMGPGKLPIPVGISYAWYKQDWGSEGYCNQPIKFYPANDPTSCAGWHIYDGQDIPNDKGKLNDWNNASTTALRDTVGGLTRGTYSSPETIAGVTTYKFTGGNNATLLDSKNFDSLKNLFDNNAVLDNDGRCAAALAPLGMTYQGYSWTTAVAIYAPTGTGMTLTQSLNDAACGNPQGDQLIVGFSTVTICKVTGPPDPQLIEAIVSCDSITSGPGGGPIDAGTSGTIPNLVQ